ncbi:MAG: sulfite exporter TauE/SafE family protein [Thermoprotei archaeon]|nr:MAG: sulfite exporter TauE/SafE family protein [Thermoprotei archaeon]
MDAIAVILELLLGFSAGFAGALLGVGGGFLITPILVLLLNMPIHVAVATSLIAVTMTSISGTLFYAKRGMIDYRLGLILEITTAIGAMTGSRIAIFLPESIVELLFGLVLMYASIKMIMPKRADKKESIGRVEYKRMHLGLAASFLAGMASGMLGIGGGTVKVPIMNLILNVPMNVAAPTSIFMIGLTSSTASLVYLIKGYVDLVAASIISLGVFVGAQLGGRVGVRLRNVVLRRSFGVVLFFTAFRMVLKAFGV